MMQVPDSPEIQRKLKEAKYSHPVIRDLLEMPASLRKNLKATIVIHDRNEEHYPVPISIQGRKIEVHRGRETEIPVPYLMNLARSTITRNAKTFDPETNQYKNRLVRIQQFPWEIVPDENLENIRRAIREYKKGSKKKDKES